MFASSSVSNRPHLAGRCPAALDRLAADDPAHRGITPEPVGVVDILVAGETPIDGLAKETDDAVPAVPARAAIREHAARQCGQPERVVQFAISEQPRVGRSPAIRGTPVSGGGRKGAGVAHDPIHPPGSASELPSDTLKPVILIAESCQSGIRRSGHLGNAGLDAFTLHAMPDRQKGSRRDIPIQAGGVVGVLRACGAGGA